MTVAPPRPSAEPAAAQPAAAAKPRRDFGPVRWVPRAIVLLLIAYWLLVLVPGSEVYAPYAADAVIYAIVGLSLNIVIGYTGQLSLGHQGFFGVGAFATAYSITVQNVPFLATFVISAVMGALFALLLGVVALRITGLYLALITLVFGLTLEASIFEIPAITNGGAGQPAERPESLLFLPSGWLFDDGNFYLFCLLFLALAVYIDYRLIKSKSGRALLALKENERVAEAFGINVTSYKLLAFTLSGALAGIAGALFSYRIGIVTGSGFGFALALTFVLMTVVGGLGSRIGVMLGATLFAALDYVLEETPLKVVEDFIFRSDNATQFAPQFIGALGLLLTITKYPGGIGQQIKPFTDWLAGKPFSVHGHDDSGPAAVEGSSVRA